MAATLPGCDVGAAVGSFHGGNGRVSRHVEKDQVEGHKVHQGAQQHDWIPAKAIILAQQAEEASTCRLRHVTASKVSTITEPVMGYTAGPGNELPAVQYPPQTVSKVKWQSYSI